MRDVSDQTKQYFIDEYRNIHSNKQVGMMIGEQLLYWVWNIQDLTFQHAGDVRILDFGCGKGYAYKKRYVHRLWDTTKIIMYDIGIPSYEKKPQLGEFNAVISCDVLEHIPEEQLDEVFNYWYSGPNMKFVFCTIAGYPARAKLSDGTNAHVTLRPRDWWVKKIKEHCTCTTEIIYFPSRKVSPERVILKNNS